MANNNKLESLFDNANNNQSPSKLPTTGTAFSNCIVVEERANSTSPVKVLPSLLPSNSTGDHTVPIFSTNGADSVSNPISLPQALASTISSTSPVTAYSPATKSLDSKPLWLRNSLLSVSSDATTLASTPSTLAGKPLILPGTTAAAAPSTGTTTHPMMYQIMSPTCISHPLLAPVLTVLKSPPGLVPTPSMLLTNPLTAVNQGLALQSVIKTVSSSNPAVVAQPHSNQVPSDSKTPDDNDNGSTTTAILDKPVMAATGQAVPTYDISPVTSTTSTPHPHPRTLASILPSELTPDLVELKAFAEDFKTRRIRLGFTQGSVGQSLAERGYNNFAQSTISRFEQMQLSPANAATIRVILEKWLLEAESPEPAPISTSAVSPQMAGRKRKKRAVFSPQTRTVLEEFFAQNPRPNRQSIESISQKLDLLPEEVRVWFCNKRQKTKSGSVSSSGMIHQTSFDRESSLSTTSSGVPSPTFSDGGKHRSPSPPKTPFTIEELSKSSTASTLPLLGSPGAVSTPPTAAVASLGIISSVTQSMSPLFSSGAASNGVFSNTLLPAPFVANTRA